jgi:cytochrome c oxidase subunit 1
MIIIITIKLFLIIINIIFFEVICSFLIKIVTVIYNVVYYKSGRWFFSTNHEDIGTMYVIFGVVSGLLGTTLSWVIRLELAQPGSHNLVGNSQLNEIIISVEAYMMIVFMIIPMLIGGFGTYVIPHRIGSPDMAFPRLNNFSFWLLPISLSLLLVSALISDSTVNITYFDSSSNLALFSLYLAGISFWLGSINFIVTICNKRCLDMTVIRLPMVVRDSFIINVLLFFFVPVLLARVQSFYWVFI